MEEQQPPGVLCSLNVGGVRRLEWNGRQVQTGIFKSPVPGRRPVRGANIEGDDQADRRAHGGPDKAVYAYAADDYDWWASELARDLAPATFGENLTVGGMDLTRAVVGERWQVGDAVLRVTQPRIPCYKLGLRMGDARFPSRFAEAARPGAYLAVERDGTVGTGDRIVLLSRPGHGLTVGDVERAYHADRGLVPCLLAVEHLPDGWRAWARHQLDRRA